MRPVLDYENGDVLYRRSKPHSAEDHFKETRLGGISTNWSKICSKKEVVLFSTPGSRYLYSTKFTKVLVFDTSVYPDGKLPERVFFDDKGNSLRVIVEHAPLKSNYSHCDLNAYLTTIDGKFDDSLVKPEDYNRHPLKKQLRQLRNDYRNELAYWFQFEDEEDGEEDVIEVRLEPPSSGQ